MSTFENGWICPSCWCANREFDERCYRCHTERPAHAPLTAKPAAPSAPSAPSAEVAMAVPKAPAPVAASSASEGPAASQPGHYCLRCGHRLLDRASFCTQCGTAIQAQEAVPEAPGTVTAAPGARAHGVRVPTVRVPSLRMSRPAVHAPPVPDVGSFVRRLPQLFNAFQARHEVRWEIAMSAIAVTGTTLAVVAERVTDPLAGRLGAMLVLVTLVMVGEYGLRLALAVDRRRFAIDHVLELAALLPPLRLLRVLRLDWLLALGPLVDRMRAARRPLAVSIPISRATAAWLALLAAAALATFAYVGTGDVRGRELFFVAVVLLLSAFSGVTSVMLAHAMGWTTLSGATRSSRGVARPAAPTPKNAQVWVAAPEAPAAAEGPDAAAETGPLARRPARVPRAADGTP